MEMDRQDERSGGFNEIYEQLNSSYCQFQSSSPDSFHNRTMKELNDHLHSTFGSFKSGSHTPRPKRLDQGKNHGDHDSQDAEDQNSGDLLVTLFIYILLFMLKYPQSHMELSVLPCHSFCSNTIELYTWKFAS